MSRFGVSDLSRGWKLLEQMGYKDGEGLGANKQGRKDPVGLFLKRGRSGLGAAAPHEERTSKKRTKRQPLQSTSSCKQTYQMHLTWQNISYHLIAVCFSQGSNTKIC